MMAYYRADKTSPAYSRKLKRGITHLRPRPQGNKKFKPESIFKMKNERDGFEGKFGASFLGNEWAKQKYGDRFWLYPSLN